jgi:acid stress chaperone HdeB
MRTLSLALSAVALMSSASARAEVVDMAAITCGELIDMKADDAGTILVWVHGYFGGMADDTKFDFKAFKELSQAIGEYCAKNKKVTLISAVKTVANRTSWVQDRTSAIDLAFRKPLRYPAELRCPLPRGSSLGSRYSRPNGPIAVT